MTAQTFRKGYFPMNAQPIRRRFLSRWLVLLGAAISATAGADTGPTLADAAIYSTVVVPANLVLTPSVEWPTGVSDSYYSLGSSSYNSSYEYIGYANPNYCYDYVQNTGSSSLTPTFGALNGYFQPAGAATNHTCSGHWSGNFLNWVWTHTIDSFRKTLSGGARIVDVGGSSGITVLQKAFSSADGGSSQGTKSISGAAVVSGATPFSWSNFYTVDLYSGANFFFSNTSFSGSKSLATQAFGASCSTANATGSASNSSGSTSTDLQLTANNALTLVPGCSGLVATDHINAGSSSAVTANMTVAMDSSTPLAGVGFSFSTASLTSSKSSSSSPDAALTITVPLAAAPGTYKVNITATNANSSTKKATVQLTLTVSSAIYSVQGAVQVCTSGELSGSNSEAESNSYTATAPDGTSMAVNGRCRGYPYGDDATPTNYKPIGLMQKYAAETNSGFHGITDNIRYSIFGYLKDTTGDQYLDGGVMRARMKSVGPYQANPGASPKLNNITTNAISLTSAEWNLDGTVVINPDANDAANTPNVTNGGSTANTNGVTGSGVMNYLNKFGFPSASGFTTGATSLLTYKHLDSVSELYYMAARYYRNLPNLTSHTSTASEITNGTATNDQFPVIENWDDPIAYTCSKNYIIGVGDIHTWYDGNVPGSSTVKNYENANYSPADDAAVSATAATNYIGALEGTNNAGPTTGTNQVTGSLANIGNNVLASGCGDGGTSTATTGFGCTGSTFYIAGLAFDMHVRDIRPDLTKKTSPVTVSTFWLDVMEGNTYHQKNQYWLAAKYGGFDTLGTYPQTDGTVKPFPINPDANSQVNPNNNGTATVGGSGAANTYTPGSTTSTITFPAGSGTATTTAMLPLTAWNTNAYTDDRGNYAPDQYYQAGKPWKMTAGISNAFQKITAAVPSGTAAALALSSNSVVSSGNMNFPTNYDYKYGGDIQAQQITLSQAGGVISQTGVTTLWDARSFLPPGTGTGALTATSRLIATSSAQGASKGVPFEVANLSAAQLSTLGSSNTSTSGFAQKNILNYLRGDQCNETASGTALSTTCQTTTGNTTSLGYRPRTTVLGDIINAQTVLVSAPNALYGDAPLNPGYSAFKATMTNSSGTSARGTMLYVGANDGMMHAFDASTGIERFAYVPSALFTTNKDSKGNPVGLASLAINPLQHHYMVDGQAVVVDIDINRSGITNGTSNTNWGSAASLATDWRSVLIGGLGKGGGSSVTSGTCTPSGGSGCNVGGGYYAIDVTNPTSSTISVPSSITTSPTASAGLSGISSETALAKKVLWEINQGSAGFAHMGYSYGTPVVIKTKNYGWTLVLTSGYDNDDGSGWIYLVNPATGALLESISTGTGSTASPAGLAQVTASIPDSSDYTADALYAGDLLGNVWRVDLTQSSMAIKLFAKLTAPDGSAQPVTTRPTTGVDPTAGTRYVFVGTGKLLADTDLVLSQTQTFYAFQDGTNTGFDTTSAFPITRSMLVADNLTSGLGSTLASNVRGFYIDLAAAQKDPNNTATQASAERITIQPTAFSGIVGFAANLQGQDVCIKGSSRVFELNYDSGYSSNGTLAGIGKSLIVNSSGAVASFVGYSTGLVTNLGFGTSTSGLNGTGTPIITLLVGLDTTGGGNNQTPKSQLNGLASVRSVATKSRLNWREVQSGQ